MPALAHTNGSGSAVNGSGGVGGSDSTRRPGPTTPRVPHPTRRPGSGSRRTRGKRVPRSWSSRTVTALSRLVSAFFIGPAASREARWDICNQTPWPIWVEYGNGRVFTLAPFEKRTSSADPRQDVPLQRVVDAGKIAVSKQPEEPERRLLHWLRSTLLLAVIWLAATLVLPRTAWQATGITLGVVVAGGLVACLARPGGLEQIRRLWRWSV